MKIVRLGPGTTLIRHCVDVSPGRVSRGTECCAIHACLTVGVWKSKAELVSIRRTQQLFKPSKKNATKLKSTYDEWMRAVERSKHWNMMAKSWVVWLSRSLLRLSTSTDRSSRFFLVLIVTAAFCSERVMLWEDEHLKVDFVFLLTCNSTMPTLTGRYTQRKMTCQI